MGFIHFILIQFLSVDKLNPAIGIANPFRQCLQSFPTYYHKVVMFIGTHDLHGNGMFFFNLDVESEVFTKWCFDNQIFIIFIYLTLNSNQEPVFMYDESQVYKTHLFSWRYFIIKIFPATLLIIFSYFILLSLKWNVFSKSNFLCLLVTALLGYILWQEFYQFFHLMSFYGNLAWVYDVEEHLWNLEVEFRRTRITNHYVTICLVAKFWHLVFVVVFWMFFVLRSLEFGRIRYPLMSANFQNFIIVYIMSWAYMYPWFKYIWKS